jgi:hypothetical protein
MAARDAERRTLASLQVLDGVTIVISSWLYDAVVAKSYKNWPKVKLEPGSEKCSEERSDGIDRPHWGCLTIGVAHLGPS